MSNIVTVPASRLAWGMHDHQKGLNAGEGDIHASYSADTIVSGNKVRRPFTFNGNPWVCTSMRGRGDVEEAEAYRLVHVKLFKGTVTNYSEKTGTEQGAEIARSDPLGFYHSMLVKSRKDSFVIGPPTTFIAEPMPERHANSVGQSEQLSLFQPHRSRASVPPSEHAPGIS